MNTNESQTPKGVVVRLEHCTLGWNVHIEHPDLARRFFRSAIYHHDHDIAIEHMDNVKASLKDTLENCFAGSPLWTLPGLPTESIETHAGGGYTVWDMDGNQHQHMTLRQALQAIGMDTKTLTREQLSDYCELR